MLLRNDWNGIRTLTLNRPHRRNAINPTLWAALRGELTRATEDRDVRAVVITGAGGAFCSGADIAVRNHAHPLARMRVVNDVALLLHDLPVPTIAKVTGQAVGAGWNLALGCDFVVCTPESKFSQIYAKRGLSLDLGGSWLLPKLVGLQQAKRLALLAETIDAEEARVMNLVTWVVSAPEIDGFVDDLGARLVAGPAISLAQIKALLNEGADHSMRDSLAGESRAQAINLATADAREAFSAFSEKRKPSFTGQWAVPDQPAGSVRTADPRRIGT